MEYGNVPQSAQERMVGFIQYCGGELMSCSPAGVEMHIQVQPHHLNSLGKVHGGLIAAVMDATAGLMASYAGPEPRVAVTRSADVHYFLPVSGSLVNAQGHVIRAGKTMCLVYVDVLDESATICATGAFEYFYMDNR